MALVISLLSAKFDGWFAAITLGALALPIAFTVSVTRVAHAFPPRDERAGQQASTAPSTLLTTRPSGFGGRPSSVRATENLLAPGQASVKSQTSLSLLNLGQSLIVAAAVVLLVWRATLGVVEGSMTLGDLVLVNADDQLYVPLNFLGVIYREINGRPSTWRCSRCSASTARWPMRRRATAAAARWRRALRERALRLRHRSRDPARREFRDSGRAHGRRGRPLRTGKSTLAQLLFRFTTSARAASASTARTSARSRRACAGAVGIVPQDTVLFNDTVEYNIATAAPAPGAPSGGGRPRGTHPRLHRLHAARHDTMVGERGLKTQRRREAARDVARTLLKNPLLLIGDEGHLGAGLNQRARHPGGAAQRRAEQDGAGDRAPPVHRRRCATRSW